MTAVVTARHGQVAVFVAINHCSAAAATPLAMTNARKQAGNARDMRRPMLASAIGQALGWAIHRPATPVDVG